MRLDFNRPTIHAGRLVARKTLVLDKTLWAFTHLLHLLDPETAHELTVWSAQHRMAPSLRAFEDPILSSILWDREFINPFGLAAGFDKNGVVIDPLQRQGFGFIEIGSVTPRPQLGNPRPRLFRLPKDRAVINRMGFNNDGHGAVAARVARRQRTRVLGVNLGKNKDTVQAVTDYVAGVKVFAEIADYLVINVSSPNTPGLRALQGKSALSEILDAALTERARLGAISRPPLLLKIAPDLTGSELDDIAQVALDLGIDGLICTNTTLMRPSRLRDTKRMEDGGLSGRPLFDLSTQVLSEMYARVGKCLPLIGSGGVESGKMAYAKIRAGASLVQVYTAFIYEGPGLLNRLKRDLVGLLRADGFTSVSQAVGADHR